MLKKFLTVFSAMGISLLTVNIDTDREFKLNQAYATENDYTFRFYTKQDKLAEIIAPNAQVEIVAKGFEFIEGPLWHPDGFLLFSDIPANTIYQWQPKQNTKVFRQPSGNANGNTFDQAGLLITGEHGNRRVSRTEKDGQIVTLADSISR